MKKPCPSAYQELITKPEINFWVPIITTVVLIAGSFMALRGTVDLQNQKLDTVIANQTEILKKYENVQVRVGTAELNIGVLQTNQKIVMKSIGIN
jgi:hypothetical protein